MINKIQIAASFIFFGYAGMAQCPTQTIEFTTQAEVNAFPTDYPGCTFLADGIDVSIMGTNITDLSPLSQLTGVQGVLEVRDCPNLTSLDGLNNITIIGNDALDGFILRDLPALTNVSALSALDSVTGEFTIRTCAQLNDLSGFAGLVYVNGSVIIRDNASLTSLSGFDQLNYIGETLELVENTSLTDISALSAVDTIVGGIEGGVFIEACTSLGSLTGLGNADTHIGSNLDLLLNDDLSLCAVPSICKYLFNPPAGAVITINGNLTGCNSQTEIENLCPSVGLGDINETANVFMLHNNQVTDILKITTNKDQTIKIYQLEGACSSYFIHQGENSIALQHLAAGIYILTTESGKTFKIVKI